MSYSLRLGRLLKSQTVWSLVDQGAVSGGNFFTTLILARSLAPAEYGAFTLLFVALFAMNTCHSSLIVYPLTLRGATADTPELRRLTGAAIVHTVLLAAPLSVVLGVTAFFLHQLAILPFLILCMLLWQLQETVRRGLLSALRFSDAILPDLFCYGGQALLLLAMHTHRLSLIFLVIAFTSLVAALWQGLLLRVSGFRSLFTEHAAWSWQMGRFILVGNGLNSLALQWPGWILLAAAGAGAVGDYQSVFSLAGIMNPLIFSINSLLIPVIAKEQAKGLAHTRGTALKYGLRFGAILVPAFLVLFCFPYRTMHLFYGAASPYLAMAPLLRFVVLAFALQYVATVVGAFEGGVGRPETYMYVQAISVVFLVTAGTLLITKMGVTGAVLTLLLMSSVRLVTFTLLSWVADRSTLKLATHPWTPTDGL